MTTALDTAAAWERETRDAYLDDPDDPDLRNLWIEAKRDLRKARDAARQPAA